MATFSEILDWEARADYNSPLATSKGRPWGGPGVRLSIAVWPQDQRTKDKHEVVPYIVGA
jgi:hypothetical protein